MNDVDSGDDILRLLLGLQEIDTAIDQLVYRRSALPAHEQLSGIEARAAELRPRVAEATARRDEALARQATIEAEVEAIDDRMATINARLYGNTPVGAKDAQAMSHELDSLKERRNKLEEGELELMVALDDLSGAVNALEGDARQLATELRQVQSEIADGQAAIDEELSADRSKREEIVHVIPQELLQRYEKLRTQLGGVAVAALVGAQCGGCHLTLSSTELDRVRKAPENTVSTCEECGRILVR